MSEEIFCLKITPAKANLNSPRSKLMVSGSILKTRLNFSGRWKTKSKGIYENAGQNAGLTRCCQEARGQRSSAVVNTNVTFTVDGSVSSANTHLKRMETAMASTRPSAGSPHALSRAGGSDLCKTTKLSRLSFGAHPTATSVIICLGDP